MRERGFTLAEVLITVGIIGVVAAMTMPVLIANKKAKELETALKKNTSVIQQDLLMAAMEDGTEPTPQNLASGELKLKLKPYLNVIKDCGRGTEVGACVVNPGYQPDAKNTYVTFNKEKNINYSLLDDGQLLLADGSLILFENSNPAFENILISIDVNGVQKSPNAWGQDLFTFQLTNTGKLLPAGAEGAKYTDTKYCSISSNNDMKGLGCTYKALTEPDYFKNLP